MRVDSQRNFTLHYHERPVKSLEDMRKIDGHQPTVWVPCHVDIDLDNRLFVSKPMYGRLFIRKICELAIQMKLNDKCMDSIVVVE